MSIIFYASEKNSREIGNWNVIYVAECAASAANSHSETENEDYISAVCWFSGPAQECLFAVCWNSKRMDVFCAYSSAEDGTRIVSAVCSVQLPVIFVSVGAVWNAAKEKFVFCGVTSDSRLHDGPLGSEVSLLEANVHFGDWCLLKQSFFGAFAHAFKQLEDGRFLATFPTLRQFALIDAFHASANETHSAIRIIEAPSLQSDCIVHAEVNNDDDEEDSIFWLSDVCADWTTDATMAPFAQCLESAETEAAADAPTIVLAACGDRSTFLFLLVASSAGRGAAEGLHSFRIVQLAGITHRLPCIRTPFGGNLDAAAAIAKASWLLHRNLLTEAHFEAWLVNEGVCDAAQAAFLSACARGHSPNSAKIVAVERSARFLAAQRQILASISETASSADAAAASNCFPFEKCAATGACLTTPACVICVFCAAKYAATLWPVLFSCLYCGFPVRKSKFCR